MVIDFHTHVFPDKIAKSTVSALQANSSNVPYCDGTVDGLIANMQKNNVDICVNLPVLTKPTQFETVLNFAISINQRFKDTDKKIISFAGMHPDCEDIEGKMRLVYEAGVKGVKIHPDYQGTYIDTDGYYQILKSAKKYGLIVVTHSGIDDGYKGQPVRCTPDRVLNLLNKIDYDRFVLGHYGAHRQWQEVLEKLCKTNVYFDTAVTLSKIDKDLFVDILNSHGEDRVLFATDSPWSDAEKDLKTLKSFGLSEQTLDKILYNNAVKLLGL